MLHPSDDHSQLAVEPSQLQEAQLESSNIHVFKNSRTGQLQYLAEGQHFFDLFARRPAGGGGASCHRQCNRDAAVFQSRFMRTLGFKVLLSVLSQS